jgi:hypothetical protein
MYTIQRTGSATAAAGQLRDLVGKQVPLIVAKALTFTAQKGQESVLAEMKRTFQGGASPYTLGSTRIVPATPQNLAAQVAVKNITTRGGTLPETYLFPEVFGGTRHEKRFEKALRFAGLLNPGERAVTSIYFDQVDAQGNIPAATLRNILRDLQVLQKGGKTLAAPRRKKGASGAKVGYFAGPVGKKGARGVWRREGRTIEPVLIFTSKQPTYRSRLNFEGTVAEAAQEFFEPIFQRLLAKAQAA